MLQTNGNIANRYPVEEAIRSGVVRHLDEMLCGDRPGLTDAWTRKIVRAENMAKVDFVLAARDSAEHCYQNLIREIDTEAENGIYLLGTEFQDEVLLHIADDPGVSGDMHREVPAIAQTLFADELDVTNQDISEVWLTILTRYAQARINASVSELLMRFLLDNHEAADDMASALRSLLYSYHEDTIRDMCALPSLLDDRETRDLIIMVAELEKRSGGYDDRARKFKGGASIN